MDRPYIICHMVTSLDGKVTGDFLGNMYKIGDRTASSFRLEKTQKLNHGGLWLTYQMNHEEE